MEAGGPLWLIYDYKSLGRGDDVSRKNFQFRMNTCRIDPILCFRCAYNFVVDDLITATTNLISLLTDIKLLAAIVINLPYFFVFTQSLLLILDVLIKNPFCSC